MRGASDPPRRGNSAGLTNLGSDLPAGKNSDGSEFEGGGAQIRREGSAATEAHTRRQLPLPNHVAAIVPCVAGLKFMDLRQANPLRTFMNENPPRLRCNVFETCPWRNCHFRWPGFAMNMLLA